MKILIETEPHQKRMTGMTICIQVMALQAKHLLSTLLLPTEMEVESTQLLVMLLMMSNKE
jgi:hypothetical protein